MLLLLVVDSVWSALAPRDANSRLPKPAGAMVRTLFGLLVSHLLRYSTEHDGENS
jgi:hypothetical protein